MILPVNSDNYDWDESKVVRLQMTDYSIWDELITTVETRGKQSDYRWLTTPAPEMTWLYDEMSPTTGDVHKAGKPTFHLRRKINFLAFSSCQVLKLSQVVMIDHCKVAWRPSKGFFVSWVMSLAKRGNLGENVTDQWKFSYRGTRSNSFWVVFFLISQKLFYRKRSEVMHIFIEIA